MTPEKKSPAGRFTAAQASHAGQPKQFKPTIAQSKSSQPPAMFGRAVAAPTPRPQLTPTVAQRKTGSNHAPQIAQSKQKMAAAPLRKRDAPSPRPQTRSGVMQLKVAGRQPLTQGQPPRPPVKVAQTKQLRAAAPAQPADARRAQQQAPRVVQPKPARPEQKGRPAADWRNELLAGRPLAVQRKTASATMIKVPVYGQVAPAQSPTPRAHVHGAVDVVQLTDAEVYTSTDGNTYTRRGEGTHSKKGRRGIKHAERRAWTDGENRLTTAVGNIVDGQHLRIRFEVNRQVCEYCCEWFDTTVYPALEGARQKNTKGPNKNKFKGNLTVSVQANGGTVTLPKGKDWGKVGEGY